MQKGVRSKVKGKGLIRAWTLVIAIAILVIVSLRFSKALGESNIDLSIEDNAYFKLSIEKDRFCFDEKIYLTIENKVSEILSIEIDCLNYTFATIEGLYLIEPNILNPDSEEIQCKIIGKSNEYVLEKEFFLVRCENDTENISYEEVNGKLSLVEDNSTYEEYVKNNNESFDGENSSKALEGWDDLQDNLTTLSDLEKNDELNNTTSIQENLSTNELPEKTTEKDSLKSKEEGSENDENTTNLLSELQFLESDDKSLAERYEKESIDTTDGEYEIYVLNGNIEIDYKENIDNKENREFYIEIFNFTSKEEVKIFVKLPFDIENNTHFYLWKMLEDRIETLEYKKNKENIVSFYLNDLIEESTKENDNELPNETGKYEIDRVRVKLSISKKPNFRSNIENENERKARIAIEEGNINKEFYVETNKGKIEVKSVDPKNLVTANPKIRDYTFSYKMLKLKITNISLGEEVEIIFYYPFEIVEDPKVIKFDPRTKRIIEVPFEKIDDNRIKVRIADGGEYDEDKEANGVIVDDIGIQLNEIVNGFLNPDTIGYGVNVTIRAVVESIENIENVTINITSPNNTMTTSQMSFHSNGLSGWSYVRSIIINNTAAKNLTNYQIMINLNTSGLISQGKMRSDCNDIRFTDSDGITLLNFWIENGCNTDNTTIWVKVPKIPANSLKRIYLYYGNASATNMSNGSLVFDFYDDFDGTSLNPSIWAIYSSNYAVSGGTLRLNTGGVELVNPLPFIFQNGYIAEVRVSHANTAAARYGGVLPSVASSPFTNASNANSSATILFMRGSGVTTVYYWIGSGNSASFDVANAVSTGWNFDNNVWNITGISVLGGNVKLWRARQSIVSVTGINWGKNITYVKLGSYHRASTYNIHDTIYDWIIVRKYIEPEPQVTLNNELNASQLRIYQYNYTDTWWDGRYNYTIFVRDSLGNTGTLNDSFIVSINASIFVNTTNATYRQDENVSIASNSNITNYNNEFFGLVEVYIEKNITNSWNYIATLLNDSETGTIRRFSSGSFFNLSNVTNQWNITSHLGRFRVVARVVNPYGDVLNSSNSQPLISISYFDVIPTILKINITSLNESARIDFNTNITVWNGSQVIRSSLGSLEEDLLLYETYNITFERTCTNLLHVIVRDINITRKNITSQIICNYNNNLRGLKIVTPIFALNVTNISFQNSTLSLPKKASPTHILHCKNWNFDTATCSNLNIIPKENMLDYYENETHIRFTVTKFDAYGGILLPDLVVNDIKFNNTNAKEFESIKILVNLSNYGDANVTDAKMILKIGLWNGTGLVNETNYTEYINLSSGEYLELNFTWVAKPGTWIFNATIDPDDEIEELNENNNAMVKNYTISAWHIFYGKVNSRIILSLNNGINFTQWIPETLNGTLYFADYDSTFSFSDLAPLNGTNDLYEADISLNMIGFNDSIKSLYDKNNDGLPDSYDCFIVNSREICNIPIINSTDENEGNFVTGILWDKGDGGSEYDGTQDLVFITKINKNSKGSYGTYDYEIAIPCYLRELRGSENLVVIYFELY